MKEIGSIFLFIGRFDAINFCFKPFPTKVYGFEFLVPVFVEIFDRYSEPPLTVITMMDLFWECE